MCGRFALYTEPTKVARLLQAQLVGLDEWQPSWNVPPTDPILAACDRVDSEGNVIRTLQAYRWGLVPYWAKDPATVKDTFNARAESVATKPMFRSAFERKRILGPPAVFWIRVSLSTNRPLSIFPAHAGGLGWTTVSNTKERA
jgi:putative SOS response-associated peptidase YedK